MKAKTPNGTPMITLRAKSQGALMSAAARQVAQLVGTPGSETVLVVYADNAATVFCEQLDSKPKMGLER